METTTIPTLKEQWIAFRQENPKTRIRDAARQLQVSEGELVAACTGTSVIHLRNDFRELLRQLPQLGKVMVLTRNESCVIERKGVFEDVQVDNAHVGVVVGPDIDLRMFFSKWVFGFAVADDESIGFKRSIQVFDGQGNAVIKIYSVAQTDLAAWDGIAAAFQAAEQPVSIAVMPAPAPKEYAATIDEAAFLEEWAVLKDTHDFFPLLMKYKVARQHALEIATGRFARKVANDSVTSLLEKAAASGLEIMVFVGNAGNIEIHTGPVEKILAIPGWINVMDPDFNLHLKLTDITGCWVVDKPAEGGVTSLEVFDAAGEMIVQFFGKRKPGIPEQQAWRDLLATLA